MAGWTKTITGTIVAASAVRWVNFPAIFFAMSTASFRFRSDYGRQYFDTYPPRLLASPFGRRTAVLHLAPSWRPTSSCDPWFSIRLNVQVLPSGGVPVRPSRSFRFFRLWHPPTRRPWSARETETHFDRRRHLEVRRRVPERLDAGLAVPGVLVDRDIAVVQHPHAFRITNPGRFSRVVSSRGPPDISVPVADRISFR